MKKIIPLFFLILFLPFSLIFAQEELSYEGVVKEVKEIPCSEVFNEGYICFEYIVTIPKLNTEERTAPLFSETETSKFKEGDEVYITSVTDESGNEAWSITGYVRGSSMFINNFFSDCNIGR